MRCRGYECVSLSRRILKHRKIPTSCAIPRVLELGFSCMRSSTVSSMPVPFVHDSLQISGKNPCQITASADVQRVYGWVYASSDMVPHQILADVVVVFL
ncbi:hypothetical protein AVEN_194290-1 [Araneus ventricosus]|uniref:Uncharacterized protein n=1 Tax=Araneus ventricosus TaxID=182803 RepID=A0A4Y2Q2A5_ARAVE|nr:hypothetical protein AVEN_194290-1 [Araneus ventricosus]